MIILSAYLKPIFGFSFNERSMQMKRLLLSSVACLALAGTAYADAHSTVVLDYATTQTDLFASDLIGMRVYSAETEVDASTTMAEGAETDWDDIGEINDLVVTADGTIAAVIVGVGGFLGMGEKDVALDMSQIKMMRDGDDPDDLFLVIQSSAEMLENAPGYMRTGAIAETTATADPSTSERNMLAAPSVSRDGYAPAKRVDLTAEMLTGARVYGANDEDIGEIGELLLSADGQIDRAVIDIGGFLGIGEKPVAVTFDELTILREDGGDDVKIYIDSTQEALEAQPTYQN